MFDPKATHYVVDIELINLPNRKLFDLLRKERRIFIETSSHVLINIPDGGGKFRIVCLVKPSYFGMSERISYDAFRKVTMHWQYYPVPARLLYSFAGSIGFDREFVNRFQQEYLFFSQPITASGDNYLLTLKPAGKALPGKSLIIEAVSVKDLIIGPDQWVVMQST